MVSPVGLRSLPPGRGFPTDFRQPRMDRLAYHASVSVFGHQQVNKVTEGFHRPAPSIDLIREGVMEFNTKLPPKLTTVEYSMALDSIRKEFQPKAKLIPLSHSAVAMRPDFPKTRSPGLPFIHEGYKKKKDVIEDPAAMFAIAQHWEQVGTGRALAEPDCCAFSRQQISPIGKEKVRPVWGYPTQVILEEGRFFYPLLDSIASLKTDHCYALGLEMATGGMSYLEQVVQKDYIPHHSVFVMLDWSKFDSRTPSWLIRDNFDMLAEFFDFSKEQDEYGNVYNVNAMSHRRRFKRMVDYFINTPVRLANGERFRKSSGVPSGSMFTNLLDTLANATINRFCTFHTTGFLPTADIYMGDDSFILVNQGVWNIDNYCEVASFYFGMKLNTQKTVCTKNPDNINFLGYTNFYGMPKRKMDFLVAGFIFPERTVRDPIETAARCVGQMYATMDSRAAYRWLNVLQYVISETGINTAAVDQFIQDQPERFKYLRILGYDIKSLASTSSFWNPMGEVFQVVPPLTARRNYDRRPYDSAYMNWIVT